MFPAVLRSLPTIPTLPPAVLRSLPAVLALVVGIVGQLPSSSAPHLPSSGVQLASDERGKGQPKKRCKHDRVVVSAGDLVVPDTIQPIQTALAQDIHTIKAESEQ